MRVFLTGTAALLAALSPQMAEANDSPLGRWHGTYDCQRVTATADVDIWQDQSAPSGMRGRFAFSPGPSGQGATGSFWVSVQSDTGGWRIVPDQWEVRPAGYDMLAASMYLLAGNLRGLVEHPACMGAARVISLNYAGQSTMQAAINRTPPTRSATTNSAPYKYEQPDYMKRAEEARKAQNAANCERALRGANTYCQR